MKSWLMTDFDGTTDEAYDAAMKAARDLATERPSEFHEVEVRGMGPNGETWTKAVVPVPSSTPLLSRVTYADANTSLKYLEPKLRKMMREEMVAFLRSDEGREVLDEILSGSLKSR